MPYERVMPRDLFNESKLLCCLGKLMLHFFDGQNPNVQVEHITDEHPGFNIDLDANNATLYCTNLHFTVKERELHISTTYNSRDKYPCWASYDDEADYLVFGEEGKFTKEFEDLIN